MFGKDEFDIVAINCTSGPETAAHLLKYDSCHGTYKKDTLIPKKDTIEIDGVAVKILAERDPALLPWKELDIDVVIECTGKFNKKEDAEKHIQAGAKKVLLSAPGKGDMKTVVYNVNQSILDGSETVISGSSCTTNCLAPVAKVLDEKFGIEKGYMTTVHAYTNDQKILDGTHKDLRRARAAAENIVPTTTGAAKSVGLVLPQLKGRLDGYALRVPVKTGSLVDLTCELKKTVTVEEINRAFIDAQSETLGVTNDPIVSTDTIGMCYGALVDLQLTTLMDIDGKQLVKIVAWYDNEMSYTNQLVRLASYIAKM